MIKENMELHKIKIIGITYIETYITTHKQGGNR